MEDILEVLMVFSAGHRGIVTQRRRDRLKFYADNTYLNKNQKDCTAFPSHRYDMELITSLNFLKCRNHFKLKLFCQKKVNKNIYKIKIHLSVLCAWFHCLDTETDRKLCVFLMEHKRVARNALKMQPKQSECSFL